MNKLEHIVAALNYAKDHEETWRAHRIQKEQALIEALDTNTNLEGSKTYKILEHKITITKKLTRSLDFETYKNMHFLNENQFVEMKPTINLKQLRETEENFPQEVAECITTKPAKTSVIIKGIE